MCYNSNGHISAESRWSDDLCKYHLKLYDDMTNKT